jgi:hypothetical protein
MTASSADKEVEQLECSDTASGDAKLCSVDMLKKRRQLFPLELNTSLRTQQFHSYIFTQRHKSTFSQKRFVQNDHSSFIYNSQKLETVEMSINR